MTIRMHSSSQKDLVPTLKKPAVHWKGEVWNWVFSYSTEGSKSIMKTSFLLPHHFQINDASKMLIGALSVCLVTLHSSVLLVWRQYVLGLNSLSFLRLLAGDHCILLAPSLGWLGYVPCCFTELWHSLHSFLSLSPETLLSPI